MNKTATTKTRRVASLVLANALLVTPLLAQKPLPTPAAKKPEATASKVGNLTFDSALAADSYKIYGEVRNLGQQVLPGGLMDMIEPLVPRNGSTKEFADFLTFLRLHSEALAGSRLLFATEPARPGLPQILAAVEMSTPVEAEKFERDFSGFLATLHAPAARASSGTTPKAPVAKQQEPPKLPTVPYFVNRSGSLLLVGNTAFTKQILRPDGSTPLSEDAEFRAVRERFTSEPYFLFLNLRLLMQQDHRTEDRDVISGRAEKPSTEAGTAQSDVRGASPSRSTSPPPTITVQRAEPSSPAAVETPDLEAADQEASAGQAENKPSGHDEAGDAAALVSSLMNGIFSGGAKWPDTAAFAIDSQGTSTVVRLLLANKSGVEACAIPFFPQIVSGPALVPQSPSVLPADVEMFIGASLDLPLIYDRLLASKQTQNGEPNGGGLALQTQIRTFEKKHGFKIRDELLAALGNEVAVSIPLHGITGSTAMPQSQSKPEPAQQGYMLLVAVKDQEVLRALLPKVLAAAGIVNAGESPRIVRLGDSELVTYGAVSYAFIDNFLVLAPEAATLQHALDANAARQTLSTNGSFKNSTNWAARPVLGEIYVSRAFMESMRAGTNSIMSANPETRDLLSRLNFEPEPITYALTSDGLGALHELHLPRSLITFMATQTSLASKPVVMNEAKALGALRMVNFSESEYKKSRGHGTYATLEILVEEHLLAKSLLDGVEGYKVEVMAAGEKFQASATPKEYGKTGYLSFFVDDTGVLRGGDHVGQPATASDKPIE
jgi:hypothetical protein